MNGIFEYIDATTYHQDFLGDPRDDGTPSLSASVAHLLLSRSPAHARHAHPRLNERYQRETDPKFDVGTAVHDILLNGNQNVVVVPHDNYRTNAAKEAREFARSKLMTALLTHEYERALEMCEAVTKQLAQMDIEPIPFTVGTPEVTLCWEDEGVACRARVDWLHEGNDFISDLKTTKAAAKGESWSRSILWAIGADLQVAMYCHGVEVLTGVRPRFRYVIAEVEPPFGIDIVELGEEALAVGEAKRKHAVKLWAECLEKNDWPAYGPDVYVAQPPPWESRWLTDELEEIAWAQM